MKGFNNLGNTCYLNSGLQMIIQNKELCSIVFKFADKSTILQEYANIINEYYNSTNSTINPKIIKKLVSERNNIFSGFNQQDSSEFIMFFLDLINSEINKFSKDKNLVDKLYELEIQTDTKCKVLSCLNVSTNIEKPTILMLNVDETCNTLDNCYDLSLKRVKLEGMEQYYCDNCKKKRIASQRKKVSFSSNNLIVLLRRFTQTSYKLSKYSQEIKVPIEWRNGYMLTGIVFHSGNLHGGHYVYIGKINNKWFLFNDSHVSEINKTVLINYINNGYIYYYTK